MKVDKKCTVRAILDDGLLTSNGKLSHERRDYDINKYQLIHNFKEENQRDH